MEVGRRDELAWSPKFQFKVTDSAHSALTHQVWQSLKISYLEDFWKFQNFRTNHNTFMRGKVRKSETIASFSKKTFTWFLHFDIDCHWKRVRLWIRLRCLCVFKILSLNRRKEIVFKITIKVKQNGSTVCGVINQSIQNVHFNHS